MLIKLIPQRFFKATLQILKMSLYKNFVSFDFDHKIDDTLDSEEILNLQK
jgi:hypothetical protein